MKLSHRELRKRFFDFFQNLNHQIIPPIPLVPKDDPTTLFTGSGMQQLVPYLLGKTHPQGNRLVDIQPCIRAQDIEEVGDNRHDTFFEMMGNWSLGDYFKKEQIANFFKFLTDKKIGLGLDPQKLYVTVFEGNKSAPKDEESINTWVEVFKNVGINAKVGEKIRLYPADKNWWSRAGVPEKMPVGEPGGPDSEVFYDFGTKHDNYFGEECHPNCDCGRFMEIGNSVFMQYKKLEDGSLAPLPKTNVDFGGGLERLLAATQNDPDIFKTDVFYEIVKAVENATKSKYENKDNQRAIRIIADHIKTATFIIKDNVFPSNKEQGYVLRRLIRRALVKIRQLNNDFSIENIKPIVEQVLKTYENIYFENISSDKEQIIPVMLDEIKKFEKTLKKGLHEIEKIDHISAKQAFDLYQSYGFPLEITQEIFEEKGQKIDIEEWKKLVEDHREKSRASAKGRFKGGLGDTSGQTIKYHTATHLLHQALFDILGNSVRQEGSNITSERLRFDFYSDIRPSDSDKDKIEMTINKKISESIPVESVILPKKEAEKIGAKSFFKEKYPDQVRVYFIGKNLENAYSKEFCGGPHVKNTQDIGEIKIKKLKKIGSNMYRIYAE